MRRHLITLVAGVLIAAVLLPPLTGDTAPVSPTPSEVTVLTGVLDDGQVIPLPTYVDGTTALESECHWIVSFNTVSHGISSVGTLRCYTTGRTVHVEGQGAIRSANFLIMAVRGASQPTSSGDGTFGHLKARYR